MSRALPKSGKDGTTQPPFKTIAIPPAHIIVDVGKSGVYRIHTVPQAHVQFQEAPLSLLSCRRWLSLYGPSQERIDSFPVDLGGRAAKIRTLQTLINCQRLNRPACANICSKELGNASG